MDYDSETSPVMYFMSDTTGEKAYEEFYFQARRLICGVSLRGVGWIRQCATPWLCEGFFEKLESIFAKEDFTMAQVVDAIKRFIPSFDHEEKGKNLDQKM